MLFANVWESIGDFFCWGFVLLGLLFWGAMYLIGSAVESVGKSDTVREIGRRVADRVADEATDQAAEGIAEWFFGKK